ncbi:MAG: hypothetical protein HY611_10265 [Elusimicrobia bacterium]|nr:hypothetical protein [Elusimicrobiota bacterium]
MTRTAFAGGFLFAVVQFSYYLLLEWHLSSAWTSYAAVAAAWLSGTVIGLASRRTAAPGILAAVNLAAYYCLWGTAVLFPFDDRFLPLYMAAIAMSGASAGFFFRWCFLRMADARGVLFHENNGFVLGWVLNFLGYSLYGYSYLLAAPAAAALLFLAAVKFHSLPRP